MSWLLGGCYGLVLMSVSGALHLSQVPRFIGETTRHSAGIRCQTSAKVKWYKLSRYDQDRREAVELKAGTSIKMSPNGTILNLLNLRVGDSGLYLCKVNDTWGAGTQLQVARAVNLKKAQYRTRLKDGLIIFQALLLAVCVAALMLRKQVVLLAQLVMEKKDSVYEEPENDHIYEGLMIEECGGGLYEELSPYAQPEGAEAPWE